MTTRQAACDPCRKAKLACDHKKPVCTRCEQGRKTALCVYRASPFQRRRSQRTSAPANRVSCTINGDSDSVGSPQSLTPHQRDPFPNVANFGSMSHVAIFDQIRPPVSQNPVASSSINPISTIHQSPNNSINLSSAAKQTAGSLKQLLSKFDLGAMKNLVDFWHARGVSLCLAEPITYQCTDSIDYLRENLLTNDSDWHTSLTAQLLQNSTRPLESNKRSTISNFTTQFCGPYVRWETLGIFFSSVIRATFDISFFPHLYSGETQKNELRTLSSRLNKHALDLCLSLDCLNDLQMVFQYESFIANTFINGDHDMSTWRGLGDAIGSLFALKYHENTQNYANVPAFLVELRRTAFARLYSADKNYAIFLGRPPRMSKRFCHFQFPRGSVTPEDDMAGSDVRLNEDSWPTDTKMNYASETRWSALCALLKEEILEHLFSSTQDMSIDEAMKIEERAEKYWEAMPARLRLRGSLKRQTNITPFERDFMAGTRLNYLHVKFLLRLSQLISLADPDHGIIEIAQQMLSLTVETILLREHLANSGTGLTWKIAYFGLPAAGVLVIAMLNRHRLSNTVTLSQNRVWQDLNVLAAEIQSGSIIRPGEPNYALLFKASQTIQDFLDSLNTGRDSNQQDNEVGRQDYPEFDEWIGQWNADPWNMEIEFWQNLGEHPFIAGVNPDFQDVH